MTLSRRWRTSDARSIELQRGFRVESCRRMKGPAIAVPERGSMSITEYAQTESIPG